MNWLEIVVLVVLLLCMVLGFRKGLLKQGLILFGALILLWLMSFLLPYTKQVIAGHTPIEKIVSAKVDDAVKKKMDSMVSQAGEAGDIALPAAGASGRELSKAQQTDLITTSGLPGFLQDILLENNNNEIYNRLGIDNFIDYLKSYLTELIINVIAYVTTFVLAFILYRLILAAAHLVDHLPLARGLNHGLGGILGLASGLILVWVFFAVLIPLCRTQLGTACYSCIEHSTYLRLLYTHNPIMAVVSAVTG